MAGEYSDLKSAWWLLKDGRLADSPRHVHFVLSDLCNEDCSWCSYRWTGYSSNELFVGDSKAATYGHNNPVRWIPTSRALALLDEFKRAGVQAIQYTGGGEPTVHPEHEKVMQRGLDLGFKQALVSNGLKWSAELKSIILPQFSWVRVSIDAGTATTYSKTRGTPLHAWDKVLENCRSLSGWIKAQRSACTFGVGWVVTTENWREIVEGVQVAKDVGAVNVRLSALFSPDGSKPYVDIYEDIKGLIAEARARYQDDGFLVHDRFGERVQDLVDGNPDYKNCPYMRYTTYVGGDQNNYICCVYSYSKRGKMTSLKDQPFDEWWASDERKQFMDKFDARGCERCMFNDKNRALNYLLEDDPKHKEFT